MFEWWHVFFNEKIKKHSIQCNSLRTESSPPSCLGRYRFTLYVSSSYLSIANLRYISPLSLAETTIRGQSHCTLNKMPPQWIFDNVRRDYDAMKSSTLSAMKRCLIRNVTTPSDKKSDHQSVMLCTHQCHCLPMQRTLSDNGGSTHHIFCIARNCTTPPNMLLEAFDRL